MKPLDCDIIKDLLPNYIDKVSSDSTNKLIEEHIQTCENCNKALKDMSTEINAEPLYAQNEQIDYLKGYRKKKIMSIIASIIITILVLLNCTILLIYFLNKSELFINIEDIFIDCYSQSQDNEKHNFMFNMCDYDNKFDFKCYQYKVKEDTGIETLHIKAVGKYPFGKTSGGWCYVQIDDSIEKVYLEDKEGNKTEIWNKDIGLQMRDLTEVKIMN